MQKAIGPSNLLGAAAPAPTLVRVDVFDSAGSCAHELIGSFLLDPERPIADHRDTPPDRLDPVLANLARGVRREGELRALAATALAEEHAAAPIGDEVVAVHFERARNAVRVVRRPAGLAGRLARMGCGAVATPSRGDEALELRRDAAMAREFGRAMMLASAGILDAGGVRSGALPMLLSASVNMHRLALACSRLAAELEDGAEAG